MNEIRQKALKLISKKEYCSSKLRDKLIAEFGDVLEVYEVLDEFLTLSIIDDSRYAEIFIRSKSNAGYGRNYIDNELEKLGLFLSDYPELEEEYLCVKKEQERALKVLAGYHGRAKDLQSALKNRLLNKGFQQSVSISAIKQFMSEKSLA